MCMPAVILAEPLPEDYIKALKNAGSEDAKAGV